MTNPINYDPNTPTVKLSFADWQIQFIQNFTQLGLAFSQNHVALDDPTVANRGNHTYVQMPQQNTDAQTGSTEMSIFSKNVEGQTNQVFITYPGNTPVVQYTNYQIFSHTDTDQQIAYFTFLPGGILIYFGRFISKGSGKNILYLNPFVAKNVVSINLCMTGTTAKYTPEISLGAWSVDSNGHLSQSKQDIIREVYILPNLNDTGDQSMYYFVVANI